MKFSSKDYQDKMGTGQAMGPDVVGAIDLEPPYSFDEEGAFCDCALFCSSCSLAHQSRSFVMIPEFDTAREPEHIAMLAFGLGFEQDGSAIMHRVIKRLPYRDTSA